MKEIMIIDGDKKYNASFQKENREYNLPYPGEEPTNPKLQKYLPTLTHPNLFEDIILYELNKKVEGEIDVLRAIFFTFNMRNVANLNKASDNLMVNDEGGTGKDHLVSAVFDILPPEEAIKRIRISPKVLSYLNDKKNDPTGWTKKCLYLEDIPNFVLNDDCFKVMCSSDPNGESETSVVQNQKLINISIVGKPSIVITIASSNPKQETLRRFPIVNLNSTSNQTRAILKKQAQSAMSGKTIDYDQDVINAQKFLKRIKVKIPFGNLIENIFPDGNVIVRTFFPRFLDYIKSVCALYQHQRKCDEEGYYIATEQDYEIARKIITITTSNHLMIPLTKNQKLIIETAKQNNVSEHTFQEWYNLLQKIPLKERQLRNQLDKLVEWGFFSRSNIKTEGISKPQVAYKFNEIIKLELPPYKNLNINTNNTLITNTTNTTNNANTIQNQDYLQQMHYLQSNSENENVEIEEIIYHKCSKCKKYPCKTFDSNGQPICEDCMSE